MRLTSRELADETGAIVAEQDGQTLGCLMTKPVDRGPYFGRPSRPADGATSRRAAEWRVLEHAGLVLDQLDAAVEGAVLDHLEGDVRIAVVDTFFARGPGDHWEHHDPEAVDESGS